MLAYRLILMIFSAVWNSGRSSILTIHNCVMYPVVARWLASGRMTKLGVDLATAFGIDAASSTDGWKEWNASTVSSGINECLGQYCQKNGCRQAPDDRSSWSESQCVFQESTPDYPRGGLCARDPSDFCSSVADVSNLSADLGGPGVR